MECFEWWTFEISTIVAGSVDELQLAVNTILMQFGLISFAVRKYYFYQYLKDLLYCCCRFPLALEQLLVFASGMSLELVTHRKLSGWHLQLS